MGEPVLPGYLLHVETLPGPEGAPASSVPGVTAARSETLAETAAPAEPGPNIPLPVALAAAFLLGAVLSLAVSALGRRLRRRNAAPPAKIAVGKVHEIGARKEQQDSFSVSDPAVRSTLGTLAVVADGMGGLAGGAQVSQCAVSAVMERFYRLQGDPERVLLLLAEEANRAVNQLLGEAGRRKSGSTLVMGLLKGGKFYHLSVGDSRICLLRQGRLHTLNREHVYRDELALKAVNATGTWEEADTHPRGAGLTSYLGMGELKYLDIPQQPLAVLPGDKLILMSDGVYNALSEAELVQALDAPAPRAAKALKAAIQEKAHPCQDNYTAVLIDCAKEATS